jgi:crotonobetainyl-CoA hydratase
MTGIRTERRGGVLEITLDRPKANAVDAATSRAMGAAFVELRDDPALRVGLVTGAGERFFSAGWDLTAAEADGPDPDYGPGGFMGLTELFDLNKPVVGAINGMAVGGGFELALACDLVVAAEHAEFFLPEIAIGIVADAGGVLRLPRRIPRAVAMDLLLTGRRMPAREALGWGLVNRVVPAERLLAEARELADGLAQSAPLAIAAVKEVVAATEGLDLAAAYAAMWALPAYREMLASEDAREGREAWVQRRPPVWRGR